MASQAPLVSNQTTYKVAGTLVGIYTIQSSDSFATVASKLGLDLNAVIAANPGVDPQNLQVGQTINLPTKSTGLVFNLNDVANVLGVLIQTLQSTNPGISSILSINETIQAPASAPSGGSGAFPGSVGGTSGGGAYVNYSGPASNFPDPSQWASFSALWNSNSQLMKLNDSDSEMALIQSSIETVASESGVDARVILCIIMQESGGNVRIATTISPDGTVRNPGIMQTHNGVAFDPANPAGSILQMVRDGTEGTASGDGLKQCFAHQGNWYAAMREYNSGSVDANDMNDGVGATALYVQSVANRLMGHTWNGM